jgi:hypothetical protein
LRRTRRTRIVVQLGPLAAVLAVARGLIGAAAQQAVVVVSRATATVATGGRREVEGEIVGGRGRPPRVVALLVRGERGTGRQHTLVAEDEVVDPPGEIHDQADDQCIVISVIPPMLYALRMVT